MCQLCRNFITAYASVPVLRIGSPPSLIPFFYRNVHHHTALRHWFGSEDTIYRSIVLFFLKPNAQVQAMKEEHMRQFWKRDQNSVVVGVHLRLGREHAPRLCVFALCTLHLIHRRFVLWTMRTLCRR